MTIIQRHEMKPKMMTKTSTNANFFLNANSTVIFPPTITHAKNRNVGANVEKVGWGGIAAFRAPPAVCVSIAEDVPQKKIHGQS